MRKTIVMCAGLFFCLFLDTANSFNLPKYALPATINGVTYQHGAIQVNNDGSGRVWYYNQTPGQQLHMCYCQCPLPLKPTVYVPYDRWDIFFTEATFCDFDSSTTNCTWNNISSSSNMGMGTYKFINGDGGQAYSDMDWVNTDSGLCYQGVPFAPANWNSTPPETAIFPEPPYQVPYTYNGEAYDYIIQIHYGQPNYHYDRVVYGKTSELEIKRPYIEKWGLNSPTLRVNYAALIPPDTTCNGDDPVIGPSYSSNNDGATWTALTNGGWCSEAGFYYQQILPTMLRSNIDIKHKGNWIYNSGAYSDCTIFPLFCWMGAKYDGDVVIPASAFGGGGTSTGASATINQITPLDGGFSISGASQTGEVSSIVKFGIEVRDDNGATVTYEATPNEDGTFSKVIEGLTNGLRYFVKVFTVDAAQAQGPASASVSVTPQAAPQDAKEWGRNLPPILLLHGWRSNGALWFLPVSVTV